LKKNDIKKNRASKTPLWAKRAERAMRRVAKNIRANNRRLGLPLIVWENGKVVEKSA
jgi:hypothetical protein